MAKYGRCGKIFGLIFTSKKKADDAREHWNEQAKKGDINLRHKVLKCKKKYVVVAETKKK